MRFPYTVRQTFTGQFEVRFDNLIGAREFFETEMEAKREALSVFAEAIQHRFENKQPIPVTPVPDSNSDYLLVPETMQKLINEHNMICLSSGDLQNSIA